MRIEDEKLIAYADGELGESERAAVDEALVSQPALRARLDAHRRLRQRLTEHYGPVAGEDVPDRLLAMLGAPRPEGIASLGAARKRRGSNARPYWRSLGAIAATLAVGVIAGQTLFPGPGGPVGVEGGKLVARAELADALDTQLASVQRASAPVRIGVTFADREGRVCRTFDAPSAAGLACRDGADWILVVTQAGREEAATQFRQAGSSLVLREAQEMMAGEPFDARAERAAMKDGWKASARPGD